MKRRRIGRYPCVVQYTIDLISRGRLREAVDRLPLLAQKGFSLNSKLIASLIRQCAYAKCIREGKLVHLHLKITGLNHPGAFLSNHLINMYARCGDHVKAREVFDKMRDRNLYSWNNMLSGYANLGMAKAARRLFDRMPERDFVSWNVMAMACLQSGLYLEALKFYMELRRLCIGFNEYSFAGVLTACVKLQNLWLAKQLHCQVFLVGFLSNVVLSSSIMDAYAKCGELGDALRLFDGMRERERDVVAWTILVLAYARGGYMVSAREVFNAMEDKTSVSWATLIAGYVHNGMGCHALKLFVEMIKLNVEPDQFTLSSCLVACASINSLVHGRQLHSFFVTSGIRLNVVVRSSLIDMYSQCGSLESAQRVFQTMGIKQHVVLWNTMISALARHGYGKQAIKCFADMLRLGVKPDGATFVALLNACKNSGLAKEGLKLFECMTSDCNVIPDEEHYLCLIDLLGRSRYFHEMTNQLKKMPFKPDNRVCRNHENMELCRIRQIAG